MKCHCCYYTIAVKSGENTCPTRLYSINTIQKRAIRLVANARSRHVHSDPLFYKYNVLKFCDLVNLHTCVFMYKIEKQLLPKNLQIFFVKSSFHHNYNTRVSNNYYQLSVRTSTKQFCLTIKGVKLWSLLSNEMKSCQSVNIFKRAYKIQCLKSYS